MRHLLISIVAVSLVAGACGKGKDDGAKGDDPKAAAAAAAPAQAAPEPYQGPLTPERLERAKDETKPFQKWDQAYARLLGTVGKPTSVEGNKHSWHLMVGEMCHELFIENNNGEVGGFGLGKYSNVMKAQFEKCPPGGDEAGGDEAGGDEPGGDEPGEQ